MPDSLGGKKHFGSYPRSCMEPLIVAPPPLLWQLECLSSILLWGVNHSLLICSDDDGQLGAVLLAACLCVFGEREASLSIYCTLGSGSADWRVHGVDLCFPMLSRALQSLHALSVHMCAWCVGPHQPHLHCSPFDPWFKCVAASLLGLKSCS